MLDLYVINNLAQLKCVSDPFRIRLLELLSETEQTGQQLADTLGIPRAKVHYHLRELEKHGLIVMVRTEQKHSIVQKYYEPVASQLMINPELIQFSPINKKLAVQHKITISAEAYADFKKEIKKLSKKAHDKSGKENVTIQVIHMTEDTPKLNIDKQLNTKSQDNAVTADK
ncbi:winged helix-turn-helix domain-containing protein [Macrococcus sp. DPC7161]|uniref:ArsR/SmtB family transcription factor n=1 Tax=Macrococcus sp. DPC7161 TaxID=2507060 RepID=UPI00100A25D7|nr:winged helix-turn-helix domain-containing protein [Macrococcus sp. DPC7161]RXK17429.1 ArsR family transcriptional regulator [Macrococcus sp. DPC7161]